MSTPKARRRAAEIRKRRVLRQAAHEAQAMCALPDCDELAVDLHEVLPRGRGGSITDPNNILAVCRGCHTKITTHPAWAEANGFARKPTPAERKGRVA